MPESSNQGLNNRNNQANVGQNKQISNNDLANQIDR